MATMTIAGVIIRLVSDKGFGFIKTDAGVQYFFHRSALIGPATFELLREGQSVTFEENTTTTRGPRANRVFIA